MKKIIYITLLILLTVSCRKNDENTIEGPSLNDLYGPFNILSELDIQNTVNFTSGENISFDMELSKRTNWEIEIIGGTTGARRILSGSERILSSDNALWQGGADEFPSFGLETAYITVRFPNEENAPIVSDSITITGLKKDKGILITSFENGFASHWELFNQTTVSGEIVCSDGKAAKGNCYYKWDGLVSWDWAVGYVKLNAPDSGFNLPANANTLFFNMGVKMISNTGPAPNGSFVQILFEEDENGDGIFNENTEDGYIYEYWYEKDEWSLLSIKYGDLKYDSEGNPVQVNGNGLPEPTKLIGIRIFFLANKDSGIRSEAFVDHVIFTENESYKP